MSTLRINRRSALAAMGGSLAASSAWRILAADPKRLFKSGACDWSIRNRGDVAAMKMAKDIGLDGVEVSFGRPGDKYDLRLEENRRLYLAEAEKQKVEICSLAMGILNEIPYATSPEAEQWVLDCIEVMPKLDQKVVLIAFFSNGDLKDKPDMSGSDPSASKGRAQGEKGASFSASSPI